jgi:hypothetical protein
MSHPARQFAGQCKEFFGFLPGQTIADFMKELKALTPKDREELTDMLNGAGYPVLPPTATS